ncbi:MAG: DegV family protein [Coriobacteriia bacterium]|nr:DegV family protein [Coriobacteriia bacterium]
MIRVITDSTSSIPEEIRTELGIQVVSLSINHGDHSFLEAEADLDAFYQDIYDFIDNIPTSSQPSPQRIAEVLSDAAAAGDPVLGVFISDRWSGTFNTVCQLAEEVATRFPGFQYALVNSLANCMELGLAAIAGAEAARDGASLDDCLAATLRSLDNSRILFSPESLRFLEAGGRIGKAAALIGNMISICPILTVVDGEATDLAKARSHKKAMSRMVKVMQEDAQAAGGLHNVAVHYIGSRDVAEQWAKDAIDPILGRPAILCPASPVIGVHVGPAVGIAYECNGPVKDKHVSARPEVVRS